MGRNGIRQYLPRTNVRTLLGTPSLCGRWSTGSAVTVLRLSLPQVNSPSNSPFTRNGWTMLSRKKKNISKHTADQAHRRGGCDTQVSRISQPCLYSHMPLYKLLPPTRILQAVSPSSIRPDPQTTDPKSAFSNLQCPQSRVATLSL